MENKIYTILVFEKLEKDETGFPDFGSDRLVGYYFNKDVAFEAVKNNYCDIAECCYNYALIEEVKEGLYRPAMKQNRWLFEYDKINDQYVEIPEPDCMKHTCGFSIG